MEEKYNAASSLEIVKVELEKWEAKFFDSVVTKMSLWLKDNEAISKTNDEICSHVHGSYMQMWKQTKVEII